MNGSLIGFIVATLLTATAIPAAGAKDTRMPRYVTKRSVSVGYNYAASSNERPIEYQVAEPLMVEVEKNERWVSLAIEDVTGRPVGAEVTQDVDSDGVADSEWSVCGETSNQIDIAAGKPLSIAFAPGTCSVIPASATSGTVHVDLFSPAPRPPADEVKVERTLAASYAGGLYQDDDGAGFGSWRIQTTSSEDHVLVRATDATGLPAHVEIFPEHGRTIRVCGNDDKPVTIPPGSELRVRLSPVPCGDGSPSGMTMGEIEVTLSNAP